MQFWIGYTKDGKRIASLMIYEIDALTISFATSQRFSYRNG